MDISQIVLYVVGGLLMIIGYFLRDKVASLDAQVTALEVKQTQHEKEDVMQHNEMFKARIEAQTQFISRTEFSDTINRVFTKLDDISKDIRHILTNKVDKEDV